MRHIDGVLPMAHMAQQMGIQTVYLPEMDAPEATLIEGIDVIPVPSVHVVSHLRDFDPIPPYEHDHVLDDRETRFTPWTSPISKGRSMSSGRWRWPAGRHNLRAHYRPARRRQDADGPLAAVDPAEADAFEALDITRIYSVTGMLPGDTPLINHRPFRAPHHTISHAGLVGGGRIPRPGEISLAHRGVLFLDELPEFGPRNLETLRQPLEDKVITISHAQGSMSFPANFMLVGAMNPCPCGSFATRNINARAAWRRSPATRSDFPARCWTASTSTSRCRGWTSRS